MNNSSWPISFLAVRKYFVNLCEQNLVQGLLGKNCGHWMPSELGETENWVRVIGAKPGASVLVCCISCGHCQMPAKWQCLARRGKVWQTESQWPSPITATAQTPDGCPWSCLFSTASKVISVRPLPFFTASISPLGPDWEVCQGPWEAQLPPSCQCQHPVFYCMAFRQYKVWIRLSELFRDSCSGSKLTRDILDFPLFGWPLHKILNGKYLKWVGNTVSPSLDSGPDKLELINGNKSHDPSSPIFINILSESNSLNFSLLKPRMN